MEAGPSRDVAIQKARDEAFRSLTELQTNALVRECMWLWDRASMGESTRELTAKFHILISSQCYAHGGQVKSLIIRSSLWRWKALPSLVAPMPRANYRHWGAEVDTFGAGSFGNIERRFLEFRPQPIFRTHPDIRGKLEVDPVSPLPGARLVIVG